MLEHFQPVSNLPFLGKVLEWVVASQIQGFLEEIGFFLGFQSCFRPRFGTETALMALTDNLYQELDR